MGIDTGGYPDFWKLGRVSMEREQVRSTSPPSQCLHQSVCSALLSTSLFLSPWTTLNRHHHCHYHSWVCMLVVDNLRLLSLHLTIPAVPDGSRSRAVKWVDWKEKRYHPRKTTVTELLVWVVSISLTRTKHWIVHELRWCWAAVMVVLCLFLFGIRAIEPRLFCASSSRRRSTWWTLCIFTHILSTSYASPRWRMSMNNAFKSCFGSR